MKKHLTVLVVDDDEDDFILLKSFFEDIKNFDSTLTWTPLYSDALELMKQNNHDVMIIDYLLGGHTGLELLKNAIEGGCKRPVIVLTGKGSHKIDLESME